MQHVQGTYLRGFAQMVTVIGYHAVQEMVAS